VFRSYTAPSWTRKSPDQNSHTDHEDIPSIMPRVTENPSLNRTSPQQPHTSLLSIPFSRYPTSRCRLPSPPSYPPAASLSNPDSPLSARSLLRLPPPRLCNAIHTGHLEFVTLERHTLVISCSIESHEERSSISSDREANPFPVLLQPRPECFPPSARQTLEPECCMSMNSIFFDRVSNPCGDHRKVFQPCKTGPNDLCLSFFAKIA